MNKEFEKLPEIAEILKSGDIFFNDVYEAYGSKSNDDLTAGFVNGALYAHQEHQQRIDKINHKLVDLHAYAGMDDRVNSIVDEIKELLK